MEHEIKIAVFTLINEINKKGKSLLQQLEVGEGDQQNSKQTVYFKASFFVSTIANIEGILFVYNPNKINIRLEYQVCLVYLLVLDSAL